LLYIIIPREPKRGRERRKLPRCKKMPDICSFSVLMRRSAILHIDLVEKPPFGIFSDAFPGPKMRVHIMYPDAG
jgi:hypothetical protein